MSTKRPTVTVGTEFRSAYADSNPLWRVTAKDGRTTWLCQIVDEPVEIGGVTFPGEWAGTQAAFTTEQIQRSLAMAQVFTSLGGETDRWWAEQTEGAVVHYHNAFGQWLRGFVVVMDDGKKGICPTAMVGAWKEWDAFRRNPDGSVTYGYHVEQIRNGKAWQPAHTTMWESGSDYVRKQDDPTWLPTLPTEPPELTDVGQYQALQHRVANHAAAILADPEQDLSRRMLVAGALLLKFRNLPWGERPEPEDLAATWHYDESDLRQALEDALTAEAKGEDDRSTAPLTETLEHLKAALDVALTRWPTIDRSNPYG